MSFDIHLACFKGGGEQRFPKSIVEDALGPFIVSKEDGLWSLNFPDGGGGDCYIRNDEEISGFIINRPGGLNLYNCVFEIMRRTTTALFWDSGIVIADHMRADDLDPGMVDALGEPIVIHSGADIVKAIEES